VCNKQKVENFTPTHLPKKMQKGSTILANQKTPTKCNKKALINNKEMPMNTKGQKGT